MTLGKRRRLGSNRGVVVQLASKRARVAACIYAALGRADRIEAQDNLVAIGLSGELASMRLRAPIGALVLGAWLVAFVRRSNWLELTNPPETKSASQARDAVGDWALVAHAERKKGEKGW